MTYYVNLMVLLTILTITHSYKLHKPVLLNESIDILVTNKDGRYIDATVGSGGHSRAILSSLTDKGSLICVDRDPESILFIQNLFNDRVSTLLGNFGLLESLLSTNSLPITGYSGILLDLGLSTHQLEESNRGFSYQNNGILDMRMSNPLFDSNSDFKSTESHNTAQYIVNNWSEERLCNLFLEFGEEPRSAAIARSIVNYRKIKPIVTTYDLRSVILKGLFGKVPFGNISNQSIQDSEFMSSNNIIADKRSYATLSRIFQSLRMVVNDELYFLERFLSICPKLVAVNGRIVIISYHSLEDRMVKYAFRSLSNIESGLNWKLVTKKCITPSKIEISNNPKSRSAKLRCIERVS